MTSDRLCVVGGKVVTPTGIVTQDLLVEGGKVVAIGHSGGLTGQVLDASGCFVIPGGVDAHAHIMEDVVAATRAAVSGGTTTVLSFTNPVAHESALAAFVRCRQEIEQAGVFADVGLHAMLYEPDRVSAEELLALREAGAAAVKVFLAYPELGIMWSVSGLYHLMKSAALTGQIVQVHCETGPLIECLVQDAAAAGGSSFLSVVETRPVAVEADSVGTVLEVARMTGASCYLVHLSSGDAIDLVRLARRRGSVRAMAETCSHYLLFDESTYRREDAERFLVAPPLRSSGDREALWEAVSDGSVDVVGSDHCQVRSPTLAELSESGEGYLYGLAGVGARLPILLSEGLRRGVPIERLVEVGCAAPARLFGHFPRKGALVPGADADVVLFDPTGLKVLDQGAFDDGTGASIYAGTEVRGEVRYVLRQGRVVVREGRLVSDVADGGYLAAGKAG